MRTTRLIPLLERYDRLLGLVVRMDDEAARAPGYRSPATADMRDELRELEGLLDATGCDWRHYDLEAAA